MLWKRRQMPAPPNMEGSGKHSVRGEKPDADDCVRCRVPLTCVSGKQSKWVCCGGTEERVETLTGPCMVVLSALTSYSHQGSAAAWWPHSSTAVSFLLSSSQTWTDTEGQRKKGEQRDTTALLHSSRMCPSTPAPAHVSNLGLGTGWVLNLCPCTWQCVQSMG